MSISPWPWTVLEGVQVLDANGLSVVWELGRHENTADHALIAAAPELLDMVRRFASGDMKLSHSEYDMNLRAEARALIERIES